MPIFLGALLVIRGLPALLRRPLAKQRKQLLAGGLLQATSLSFPIVGRQLGVDLHLVSSVNYTALVAAGLISVVAFPLAPLVLLGRGSEEEPASAPRPTLTTGG